MLRDNRLKRALNQGIETFGLLVSMPCAASIELIGEAGFDFVVIDTEHVLINPETLEHMIRTAESYGLTPLVRVPDADPKRILRLLDAGAQGIVLPQVETPETVQAAVQACKYAPEGTRSLNAGRPGAFGRDALSEYVTRANAEIMVVAMIETADGVEHIDRITAVPGLDLILEGAADLSQSLGVTWQPNHPRVVEALAHVADRARTAGVPYCAFLRGDDALPAWRARGATAFMLGDERGIAFRALTHALTHARSTQGTPRHAD
ncbi:HpcH/HpaI aldolase family protein [Larsenimonas suaedae]|uniref:Aldolase/citrate lyase family protein n=1 Tax=Larsenimonas suaedae TaxID=1851019 RepID=A0ABU1GRN7_9GAMM|nr:aldolase/citrate lyase family protein [Larsenimonas suaedae]MCM2972529.1 aldolase/citrate lyase family protein [Larsenimonas suaedae]MDR5894675.1 aldolase/citrate lyase family protein [Larsenimonas suaedae]